jgi:tetratricopeptide (TPR) repeat protein
MSFRKILPIIPILLAMVACSRDPKALVRNGNKYFERHKYKEASIMYRRALQKDRKNADAWYKLGQVDLALGELGESAGALQRAVQLDPSNTDAAGKLADIYFAASMMDGSRRQEDLGEVRSIAKDLLKRNPHSYDGLRLTGYIAMADRRLPDAVTSLEQANQIRPGQPGVVLALCQALASTDHKDEAEKLDRDLIANHKDYSQAYDFLIRLYYGENRRDDAESVLKQKVANNPGVGAFHIQLARFYQGIGKPDQMNAVLNGLTSDLHDYPSAWMLVGEFYLYSNAPNHLDDAISAFSRGETADPKNKAAYEMRRAETLITANRVPEANVIIGDVLKTTPDNPEAIALRAAIDIQTGQKDKVIKAINALQPLAGKYQNPGAAGMLHLNLGRAYNMKASFDMADPDPTRRQGDLDQARIQLEQAVQSPRNAMARVLLADVLMQQGQFARVVQLEDEILNTEPTNVRARLTRAEALERMKEPEKAREELDRILAQYPRLVEAVYQKALLDFAQKNYHEAEEGFQKVDQAGDHRGFVGVMETRLAEGQYASVQDELRKRVTANPKDNRLRIGLANAEMVGKNYADAITQYQQVLSSPAGENTPLKVDLLMRIGTAQRAVHKEDAALQTFMQARDLMPADARPLESIALIYDETGRKDLARTEYEKILKTNPDDLVALNNLAYMKADQGVDLDRALTLAQRARQKNPDSLDVMDTLGLVYLRKNLTDDGLRIMTELVDKNPKNPTFHYHRAMALVQKGDKADAKKELTTALQDRPTGDEQSKIQELMSKIG